MFRWIMWFKMIYDCIFRIYNYQFISKKSYLVFDYLVNNDKLYIITNVKKKVYN